jgi:hypothetical protein
MFTMRRHATFCLAALITLTALGLAQDKKPQERPCVFTVLLPANARLEIEGYVARSRGEIRLFESPPVPVGRTYTYTLRAIHGGIVVTRTVEVSPDKQVEIDLRPDFGIRVPVPPPAKPDKKPEEPEKVTKPPQKETQPKPTTEKPAPVGSFSVSGFRDVILTAGGTVSLRITVQREHLDSLISLEFSGLPKGITVSQTTIPAGANHLDLMIRADSSINPGKYLITVHAQAAGVQRSSKFHVLVVEEIKAKPALPPVSKPEQKAPPPTKAEPNANPAPVEQSTIKHPFSFLTVSGPKSVTLSPGQTAVITLKITRNQVGGLVHLRWLDLPSYFSAPAITLKEGDDSAPVSLSVPADAAPISREFRLQISTAGEAVRLEFPIRIEIR